MSNLDRFLSVWLPLTAHGTYRAVAWWEGGFGHKNRLLFLPVTNTEADGQAIRGLVAEHGEVFFYVNTFDSHSTKAEAAEPGRLLQLDLDTADPRHIDDPTLPAPSIVWETSAGSFQGLWILDDVLPHAQRFRLNQRLYQLYKEHGADASYDASRRLRLPGTLNLKPGRDRFIVEIVQTTGAVYSPDEIGASEAPQQEPSPEPTTITKEQGLAILKRHRLASLIRKWQTTEGDRSTHLASLLAQLAKRGLSPDEMFIVGWTADSNKFRDRPDVLWSEVHKAREKFPPNRPAEAKRGWTLHTGRELLDIDPNIEWIYQGYWPRGACGMAYGVPGARKSWVVTHLLMAVLGGCDFFGVPNEQGPQPVIVHALDDPTKQVARRIRNVADFLGIPDRGIEERLFWSASGFSFAEDYETQLRAEIARVQPALVVVDGLYLAGYNPELHGSDLPMKLKALKEIRDEPPYPSFLIVHHATKAGTGDDVRIGGAGSIFLSAWAEVAWQLNKLGRDENNRQVVQFAADSKFGSAPEPMRLTFGVNPLVYEVDAELLVLNEEAITQALAMNPEGVSADDVAALLGHAKKPTLALLMKMKGDGSVHMAKGKWTLEGGY